MEENFLMFKFEFYGLNNEYADSHEIIDYQNSNFNHIHLKQARSFILEDLSDLENKKNNDICITSFETSRGEKMQEILFYSEGIWEKLDDDKLLKNNNFEPLFESEGYTMFSPEKKETVGCWEDIVLNFKSYQDIDKKEPSQVLKYYGFFFHWYYLPEHGIFAPSKFLGYKDSTIQNYDSSGTGGETQKVLEKYFIKLDKNSEEFKRLYNELSQISKNNFKKYLNGKVLSGTGGIYVPKNDYK